MMMLQTWNIVQIALTLCALGRAQFPQPLNTSLLTVIKSPVNSNVTVSFRSPLIGTCTTVFTTQKQFSGYISLPSSVLGPGQANYTINTFFWFIEARQVPENAPFTIFINGGPGSSSMVGLFQEVGPCEVIEIAQGKLGTVARDWGWDRSSNILFVDQPTQVGFSFDSATNGSINLLNGQVTVPPGNTPYPQSPYTFLNGTFATGNPMFTANTSQIAAESMWHFLQSFFATFPEYNPQTRTPGSSAVGKRSRPGINLFTESYGGKYGPAIANYFRKQNILRQANSSFANSTLDLTVATLGIINGWIDVLTQAPLNPRFAYNNTYGIRAISQVQQLNALSSFSGPDGCQAKTLACRAQESSLDPSDSGAANLVNQLCAEAAASCQDNVVAPYLSSGRSIYDISQDAFDPFPNSFYLDYLNQAEVQQTVGTPINFTQSSQAVAIAFNGTGDYVRKRVLDDLVEIMNSTRIALIYGDRDYICNWVGGEAISFALAGAAGKVYEGWYTAGYAPIVINSSYVGGVVREYGNLSFSRIYDAGHLVPAYQPETVFTIFSRIIQGTGVSMGNQVDLSSFASSGDSNSTHRNLAPAMNDPKCFIRAANSTCNVDQKNMLANGAGIAINGVLYSAESDWKSPPASLTSIAGFPGTGPQNMLPGSSTPSTQIAGTSTASGNIQTLPTTSRIPTGVYTATSVPSITPTTTSNIAVSMRLHKSNMNLDRDTLVAALMAFGVLSFDNM